MNELVGRVKELDSITSNLKKGNNRMGLLVHDAVKVIRYDGMIVFGDVLRCIHE
eukprot:m.79686 g.79686  ORF g.79686 m.79686 type:complete len:54 (+) comp8611_c0_seq8:934-1095(+)